VNFAVPESNVLPVTVTVYTPPGTPPTRKEPDTKPPNTEQSGFGGVEIRPPGDEDN
jgi:hypothetical protein